jgi:hypothetical protein
MHSKLLKLSECLRIKKQPGQLRNGLAEVQYGTDIALLVPQWYSACEFHLWVRFQEWTMQDVKGENS